MTERVLPYNHGIVGQERSWDCGAASAQNVLSSRMHVSEADLIRSIGTTTDGTAYVGLIEQDLDRRVPDAQYTSVYIPGNKPTPDQVETFWRNAKSSIDAGWGVVCNWVSPPDNPPHAVKGSTSPRGYGSHTVYHYVAAMGYDDTARAIYIADSGFAPFGYWVTVEQCVLLIASKGYSYAAVKPTATPPPIAPTQAPPVVAPLPNGSLTDPFTGEMWSPSRYHPRGLNPGKWIAVHTSEGRNSARRLGAYLDNPANEVSYHAVVDDKELLKIVAEDDAPWSAMNANRYAFHMCFAYSFAGWSRDQWLDPSAANDGVNEDVALTNGAKVVAWWCQKYSIPASWIGGGAKPPWGAEGVCGHVDFGQWGGGHSDPGTNFPVNEFMNRVRSMLTGQPPVVIAPPPPVSVPGTDPNNYAGVLLYKGNARNNPEQVKAVQSKLQRAYASYAGHLTVDGVFGDPLDAAVREFQRRSGLVADGIVGPNTAAALKPW